VARVKPGRPGAVEDCRVELRTSAGRIAFAAGSIAFAAAIAALVTFRHRELGRNGDAAARGSPTNRPAPSMTAALPDE